MFLTDTLEVNVESQELFDCSNIEFECIIEFTQWLVEEVDRLFS